MIWGGRWEGGSGLGTRVHPWLIHVNVWQNQYSIVKQNKVKIKILKIKKEFSILFVHQYHEIPCMQIVILNITKATKCDSDSADLSKMLASNIPREFPGGPVAKNPPSNAGNVGSIPG